VVVALAAEVAVADGFLGRWSQRKQAVREGKPLQEPVLPVSSPNVAPHSPRVGTPATGGLAPAAGGQGARARGAEQGGDQALPIDPVEQTPPLTMQDAAALGTDSDYAPFAARSVAPEVRNAAMKKLFADPHYNLMDGLDTYIDDYSQPDPLPESMLRQMASAKFLKLFDEEPEASPASEPLPVAMPQPESAQPVSVAFESHPPGTAPDAVPADSQPPAGNPT
jgi:hypothetical protein